MDVCRPIIGADFQHYYGLLFDIRYTRLIDLTIDHVRERQARHHDIGTNVKADNGQTLAKSVGGVSQRFPGEYFHLAQPEP